MELHGVLPPIPTPFRPDGSLALEALKANLARWNTTGLAGYLVLGSNGEAPHLTLEEKQAVLETAREVIPRERVFMAGTGEATTRATITTTRMAAEAGADCALVITPSFYRGQMTAEVLVDHYRAAAEASPIPIFLYNVPGFTGVNLPPEAVSSLTEHANIIGIKDSLGDVGQLGRLLRETPEETTVLVGSAQAFYPGLCLGAHGGILAVACPLPERCVAIYDAFRAGDHAAALAGHLAILPVARLVTAVYGIGGLKAALDHLGYYGGPPRAPLPRPAPEDRRAIAEALDALGAVDAPPPRP
ncbi:MAG: dihydrodipicolinate synthase family protein [Candidatus Tectimicrobiota bacterium]